MGILGHEYGNPYRIGVSAPAPPVSRSRMFPLADSRKVPHYGQVDREDAGITRTGRAVAARRGELGMTQQDLADKAGVDLKTIYNLESGTRWPIARTRTAVSAALKWEGDALAAIRSGGGPHPLESGPRLPPAPEGDPFDPQTLATLAPTATAIIRRLDEVRQDGIPNPSGRQMFPDSRELALGWDAMRAAGFTPEAGLWYLAAAIVEREAERRDEDRDRSGTHGA